MLEFFNYFFGKSENVEFTNFALRLLVMAAAITALFVLSYVPWFIKDKKAAKQAAS